VSDGTLERLELAFGDLATAYPRTPSAELLSSVRAHLGYTTSLLDGRATLTQRRRLLVSGGWLSLLAATCLVDLHQERPAVAYLRTAEQLAHETCHAEIGAWVLETRAWLALTVGEYRRALELSRAAQQAAPYGNSALIQAGGPLPALGALCLARAGRRVRGAEPALAVPVRGALAAGGLLRGGGWHGRARAAVWLLPGRAPDRGLRNLADYRVVVSGWRVRCTGRWRCR
jgi:hypothetical protein